MPVPVPNPWEIPNPVRTRGARIRDNTRQYNNNYKELDGKKNPSSSNQV